MKAEIGKYYRHRPTGHVKKIVYITRDGENIKFDDISWVTKDLFDEYWEEADTSTDRSCITDKVERNIETISEELNKTIKPEHRVNHPSYYQDPSGIECITVARYRDFNIGNALKYLWRAGLKTEEGITNKEKAIEDLKKAIFYINDEIKLIENDWKS